LSQFMAIEPGGQSNPDKNRGLIPCREETVMELIVKFAADEAGATAVEYALMLALIASVIIGSVATLGGKVVGWFTVSW
ncbi:MAG TPA: Flp family type IVb pilin, partial [Desulfobaccales bacterium]|nr:Flp family type IVb pilin [Desulfobaccales bacterium]